MGRKRLTKQVSSPKSKKSKQSTGPTIDSLFKRFNEESNEQSNSTSELSNDCEIILNKAKICGEININTIIELIDEWITTEEGRVRFFMQYRIIL